MEIGFDIISDLNLGPDDSFNWENKATSLYCIVAGNISSDLRTIVQTLSHLSRFYQGIFYTLGTLEYKGFTVSRSRTEEILAAVQRIGNVAVLHHNVVIIDGVAILGANGWEGDNRRISDLILNNDENKYQDINYLNRYIEKLQRHLDVKQIVVVTHAVPKLDLYFGELPTYVDEEINLDFCLHSDTENKVKYWVFGNYDKDVDTDIDGIRYINHPYFQQRPYWAKRITVNI